MSAKNFKISLLVLRLVPRKRTEIKRCVIAHAYTALTRRAKMGNFVKFIE